MSLEWENVWRSYTARGDYEIVQVKPDRFDISYQANNEPAYYISLAETLDEAKKWCEYDHQNVTTEAQKVMFVVESLVGGLSYEGVKKWLARCDTIDEAYEAAKQIRDGMIAS